MSVAIVGAGPAGLALAAAVARRGTDVVVVDPTPRAPWKPTWSGFEDDLPGVPVRHRWARTRVELNSGPQIRERSYVQVDKVSLQEQLLAAVPELHEARVEKVERKGWGGTLHTTSGTLQADRIVDCTGAAQALADNPPPQAFQTAFGLEVTTDGHPWDPNEATWMDLRALETPPTFLYAMPFDDKRVFVEETALAWRPAVGMDLLEQRLHERLARLGVTVAEVHETERCSIPLDLAPHPHLAFGTAAGMVHPATGFLLARALALAGRFADALDEPRRAQSICAPRIRKLHLLGLESLLRSNGPATAAFFEAFFAQSHRTQDVFLGLDPGWLATTIAMSRIFVGAPLRVKWQLAAPLVSQQEQEIAWPVR